MTAPVKPLTDEQRRRGEAWLILRKYLGMATKGLVTELVEAPLAFQKTHGIKLTSDDLNRLRPNYYDRHASNDERTQKAPTKLRK